MPCWATKQALAIPNYTTRDSAENSTNGSVNYAIHDGVNEGFDDETVLEVRP